MNQTIAVFDFDGTITRKDTFLDFILCVCGFWRLLIGGIKSLPIAILFFLKLVSADEAKQKIFADFFGGMPDGEFNKLCRNYSLNKLRKIIKKEALLKIDWHKKQGHQLVIVSASIENWIKPWAKRMAFDKIIATIPDCQNGLINGKFKSKNCNREEKSRRFLLEYPNRQNYYLYVYGDSRDDDWLFQIADKKFYREF